MSNYLKLGITLVVSFVIMYLLTFSMINVIGDFYFNISNGYMALMMVCPMAIVMLVVMWGMFKNKKLKIALIAGFVVVFIAAFFMGRAETFVGNEGFLKAMIPHHSRAILVCQESDISDPEIEKLCDTIIKSQQEEIDQMKRILERY
ncbi:DUF305 domain-containing protein [Paramicrobacterium agarici]|uniref:DUF305 domain-containing protein n=1 Tax=Paramicrobacterium agarici TaxID=630514 RepID=A0A2A9DSM5_9MICO|nr:DUF305 domain-containing protein [Microbacterium agarici]PFG29593.1 protein of unknown function (DUF305) [Microbacterium agarici]